MERRSSFIKCMRENGGSAVISTVVAMIFVVVLGLSLLFAAYTGLRIKVAERGETGNFYDASTVMDEIRAGVQSRVSVAVASAYTETMENYLVFSDPEGEFKTNYRVRVLGDSQLLRYDNSTEKYHYRPEILKDFVGVDTEVPEGTKDYALICKNSYPYSVKVLADNTVVLKNITVEYHSADGYETKVTTDITINPPDFYATSVTPDVMRYYAIVAEEDLTGGLYKDNVTISGNIFVGGENGTTGIQINAGNHMVVTGGDVTCKGSIDVKSGTFILAKKGIDRRELWVREISLGNGADSGKLFLDGSVYVADDLILEGNNSEATLKGSYNGFGSNIAGKEGTAGSAESSSIIVNGKAAILDLSGLDKLTLAGVSYVDYVVLEDGADHKSSLAMGESISAKSNQLAYLVPAAAIYNYGSNPCVLLKKTNGKYRAPAYDQNYVLWGIGENAKTIYDYIGPVPGKENRGEIKVMHKNLGSGQDQILIAYVVLAFNEQKYANEYFRDYFTHNAEKVELYLEQYMNLCKKGEEIRAAGNTLFEEDNTLELVDASNVRWTDTLTKRFNNQMNSPFYSFVSEEAFEDDTFLPDGKYEFKLEDENGKLKTVAIIVKGQDYSYDGRADIRFVISDSKVTIPINMPFKGIVMTKGSVVAKANITAPQTIDDHIYNATCVINDKTYELSDFVGKGGSTNNLNSSDNAWDPDKLVTYENWTKN